MPLLAFIRLFSKSNTFWAFFSQVLDADAGCKEAVKKIQAFMASKLKKIPSGSSSAYCQARLKLESKCLDKILEYTSQQSGMDKGWKNHRVVVVDGTGLSMPDTHANQEKYPQQATQKKGCGFPQARALACFCLLSGKLLSYKLGNKKSHELILLREQHNTFKKGDIFLGDKMFCSYFDINEFKTMNVDSVITHAKRIPKDETNAIKVINKDDLLIQWQKPVHTPRTSYTKEQWQQLPDTLTLRQIKITVKNKGFRVQSFIIITTLLDAEKYSAADIADLYYQRWDVELFFRDIKTTMGMDILRCKTPEMVEKEITMHLIVYNCIRSLMIEAAESCEILPRLISFKATIQALRQWQYLLNYSTANQIKIRQAMIDVIADSTLHQRLGRSEPRCVKRRPKPYKLMTQSRAVLKALLLHGENHAKAA
ncbi:MAG: IS4 family transposase [Proteobacteria bacterium]|nr:IS4 family transposase [Pseudomonadota bacterium]